MAFSGLHCPQCKGNLFDGAVQCHRCDLPLGKKEMKKALVNEFMPLFEKMGTWRLVRLRFWLFFSLKGALVRSWCRSVRTCFRRLVIGSI